MTGGASPSRLPRTPLVLLWRLMVAVLCVACGGLGGRKQPEDQGPNEELSVAMAELLVESGAHAQAVPVLRNALVRRPKDARLHYLLGVVLRDRAVFEQAEKELQVAVGLDPGLAPALGALAVLYDLRGQPDKAIGFHRKALLAAPRVPRFHNNHGFSRYLAADYEAAVAAYEEAIRLEPTAKTVYINLGFALAAQGSDDRALRMFRQAGTSAEAYSNLGLARELRGDSKQARRAYREALQHDPGLKVALDNLNALEQETPE